MRSITMHDMTFYPAAEWLQAHDYSSHANAIARRRRCYPLEFIDYNGEVWMSDVYAGFIAENRVIQQKRYLAFAPKPDKDCFGRKIEIASASASPRNDEGGVV